MAQASAQTRRTSPTTLFTATYIMQRALSLDNSPAASVPLRFMYSSPLFVLLAALLLLWSGPQAMVARWTPQALAITHLFTLGALAHAMAGALMQILPVATGIHVLAPRLSATVVHGGLAVGTLGLATAFLTGEPWQFKLALVLLVLALAWLLGCCVGGLWRYRRQASKGSTEVLASARLALAGLFIAVLAGAWLAGHLAAAQPAPRQLTDLHGAWGLLGWVGLLIVAMSYQLIPMFQVTELYPRRVTRWLASLVFVLLLALSANMLFLHSMSAAWICQTLLATAFLTYASVTLKLLRGRKRPEPDTTTQFWRTGLWSLAACAPVWLYQQITGTDLSLLTGVLFIVGFAWSVVNGMLYKIIPFLVWFHCQRGLQAALPFIPKVRHIIEDKDARLQFRAHLTALCLLAAACVLPEELARIAALALAASALWLIVLMLNALRQLVRTKAKIRETMYPRPGRSAQP